MAYYPVPRPISVVGSDGIAFVLNGGRVPTSATKTLRPRKNFFFRRLSQDCQQPDTVEKLG